MKITLESFADESAPPTPFAMSPDALASPVTRPDIGAPTAEVDPFAPVGRGGLGLTPPGAPGLTAFGLGGPAPLEGAEAGVAPTLDGPAAFQGLPSATITDTAEPNGGPLSSKSIANQAPHLGSAQTGKADPVPAFPVLKRARGPIARAAAPDRLR